MIKDSQSPRANFGSKVGIILATAGSAVGLGNIWRFPYRTGEHGGAAFIIIYLACVLLLGIPCMLNEFIIGRHGAANSARAYAKLANGTPWKYIGLVGVITGFLIMGYYAVVSGWCLQYIFGSATGQLHGDNAAIQQYFTDFSTDAWRPVVWTVVIILAAHFIIVRGIENGIEKASKLMMPTLFILLLIIVLAACMLPGASKGITFLLSPDFSKLDSDTILGAMGQSFYSLSVGMGCIVTYASYYSRDTHLTKSAVQISLVDSLIAILAGLMIFPAAFSVGIQPDSGPSLIFITLPNVFQQAFGSVPAVGYVVSLMFYTLLSLAALTSLMSLHEVATAYVHEEFNMSRKRASTLVVITCCVMGAICSLSLGAVDGLSLFGQNIFSLFDFLTGQILLPLGGMLTCLFLGWYVPKATVREEFTNNGALRGTLFAFYLFLIRFICPLSILTVFLHQLGAF